MTQTTEHGPASTDFPQTVLVQGGRRAALVRCLLRGATAAGLGLGALTVLVMVLWISSPYPDSGPDGALHVAASLWLLAHGTELVRVETLYGTPAPIGVVPLLLAVLPAWLAHRAVRDALTPDDAELRPRPSTRTAVWGVATGYLLVGACVTVYAREGSIVPDALSALLHLPLLAFAAATTGAWSANGRLFAPPAGAPPAGAPSAGAAASKWPSWDDVRVWLSGARAAVAARAAAAGALVLLGGGAVLVASSLVWHADAAQDSFLHLADEWSGRVAVLFLGIVLVPNAAVWAAAYGLGPGFALGTGATATPLALYGDPVLPHFPLVAIVPAQGPGTPLNWSSAVVPVVAGLAVGWFGAGERGAPLRRTAANALLGAVGCGALTATLTAFAAGPLGTHRLADFGPAWWLTGAAAVVWTGALGVPVALGVRAWRGRDSAPAEAQPLKAPAKTPPTVSPKTTLKTSPKAPPVTGQPKPLSRGLGRLKTLKRAGPKPKTTAPAAEKPKPSASPLDALEGRDPLEVLDAQDGPYDFLPLDAWADRPPPSPLPPTDPSRPWAAPPSPWPSDPDGGKGGQGKGGQGA
ncbi:DUF6350 family protein [Streptomyces sp. NPDC047315]|uniref:cell division protein PerM n=1 Tax=Streptomyces sp. NPDC047315 TaxID=3155142 RepID=UPI0033C0FB95